MGASRRFRRRVAGPRRQWGDQDMRRPENRRCIDDMSPEARNVLDEALPAPEPHWNVKLVHHDPNGPCEAGCPNHDRRPGKAREVHADFGYTVGLHQRYGLPELHAPTRPLAGPPGYSIDHQSLGMVLNTAAARCITGELGPGDEFELTASRGGHRFHMTWVLGEPGPLEDCSAYQAHDDATCIPIQWLVDDVECLNEPDDRGGRKDRGGVS